MERRLLPAYTLRWRSRQAAGFSLAASMPCAFMLLGLLSTGQVLAATNAADNLADLSLEQLANIRITSVSRKPERLADAAAAIFVISNDDIRSSGASNLPEALRLAPGLQVAQISATQYAITARGSNGSSSANKLLVLIDGRTVYSPLFSGVFWDVQDVMLEDVERIEVITGPGSTLWGSNAVNGVINILTRNAKNTQGDLISITHGDQERHVAARHGGKIAVGGVEPTEIAYRLYAKYTDQQHTTLTNGNAIADGAYRREAGFKLNWAQGNDEFRLSGNVYRGVEGQPKPGTIMISGVNFELGAINLAGSTLSGRWAHLLDNGGKFDFQAYYDRTERIVPPTFSDTQEIIDILFQHSLPALGTHTPVWGGEYRYGKDKLTNSRYVAFLPDRLKQVWGSLYAQDEISLHKDWRLTLGARVEHNDYTGAEFLPSARLAWKFSGDSLLWGAVSRAVRSPSRLDRDTFVPGTPPFLLTGGPDVRAEIAKVYELGYRGQLRKGFTYAASVYRADYDHLRTQEVAAGGKSVFFGNGMQGKTQGIEMSAAYQASDSWRLIAGLSLLNEQFTLKPGSTATRDTLASGRDPAQSWSIRSMLNLPQRWELDAALRHVSALSNPVVPAYTTGDLRLGWHYGTNVELSLLGKNLFGRDHGEFSDISTRSEFGRSYSMRMTVNF